jgi:tetratricopeptide (TPR) repeat protein
LAKDAAGRGDPEGQRNLLLMAFKHAPKSELQSVLRELAFCYRTLRDSKSARRYLELSIELIPDGSPELADELYNLAILQKSDQDLEAAIATIRRGRGINPESWNLQMLEAGYLILSGQRAAGEALRTQVVKPRGEEELWLTMEAWYLVVIEDRDGFFAKLTELLERSDTVDTLIWIDQDEILDPYRKDPRFVELLRIHRQRLNAATPAQNPQTTPALPAAAPVP